MSASVLIVDDDPYVRAAVADLLRDEGYRVLVAHDGSDALRVLSHERPSLMLVDVVMPVMDGLTFVNRVKQIIPLRSIPVVMMTATMERVPPRLDLPLVSKPIEIHSLLELVQQYCGPDATAADEPVVPAPKVSDDDPDGFDCSGRV